LLERHLPLACCLLAILGGSNTACSVYDYSGSEAGEESADVRLPARQRERLSGDWRFRKYARPDQADHRPYEIRPRVGYPDRVNLRRWILPTANAFVVEPDDRLEFPDEQPSFTPPEALPDFDDSDWQHVSVPHDWAIAGPFLVGSDAAVDGGMGRLPSPGVAWYRRSVDIPAVEAGRSFFLDIDGAMSHAMVWVNGQLVGGWPYGYASWRLDVTPYVVPGDRNLIAIRLDNPPDSSRWYPGGGLYRNVWLTSSDPVHIAHWGTFVTTPEVSTSRARVVFSVRITNDLQNAQDVAVTTEVFALDANGEPHDQRAAALDPVDVTIGSRATATVGGSVTIPDPRLWGPPPGQEPNRYVAITTVRRDGAIVDTNETTFGIRKLEYDPDRGLLVNGERVHIRGVNQHHDLGALGAAFNKRAAERQLELLRAMGANAIRMAHNPPAPELLELTDRLGFLVVDEIFDAWEIEKVPNDFHSIFPDWHEADLRAFLRRDRNHPSVIMWSVGNEVGEQHLDANQTRVAERLLAIAREEDPTRPVTTSMNFAKPGMPFAAVMDAISLNYQGDGIRNAPAYAHLQGITTPPMYPAFHEAFPGKLILSSENAAALSSRGEYLFPVEPGRSAPAADGAGADPESMQVSSYELYTAPFGSSADKVFASEERNPFVAGGFVWSGWDYLGEPTPYYGARSSYFGVIDLAGFPKDRFYLYQSHWRPDLPMAHILPHWNWPQRIGEVTPVHVFTSGDEAELFLNGESQGRKRKNKQEYRLRWDDVVYEPGTLRVEAYKDGKMWATDEMQTTGPAAALMLAADRDVIVSDGDDLAFITVSVVDERGRVVPDADSMIGFQVDGPADIVATDNGDPTNFDSFHSKARNAFNGLGLVIVRGHVGATDEITVRATSPGLQPAVIHIKLMQ
jgi:beta-galactosidase